MASVQTEQPDLVLRVEESITIDIENHIKPHDGQDITPPVYSIFSTQKKRWITFLVAFGGWFSTLSSFIYFPAITALADSLQTSITKVNLTVTAYLVVSAIAPAIAGDLADMSGRRPVIVGMLGIYVVANVGLAVQRSYSALLILRMVQSAGISGIIAVVYGVVTDIASPAERGGFVGIVSFGTNTAPALGPLLGAVLLYFRGWTSIFWFLSITSSICLVMVIFLLPETARNVVGNGSIPVSGIHRLPLIRKMPDSEQFSNFTRHGWRFPNPLTCLYLFGDKDTAILILTLSIFYMTYTCLQASLSPLFISLYGINQLQAGLIYLPFGCGCAMAAYVTGNLTGKLLDRDYRITAEIYGFPTEKARGIHIVEFPMAKARLRSIAYPLTIAIATITGYGWTLEAKSHVAIPLTLQFIMGSVIQSCFTVIMTLLTDLNHDVPSTAQASCNLARCILAGIGLAVLQPIFDSIGVGWCFTIIAGISAMPMPLLLLQWHKSVAWRTAKCRITNQRTKL